jgi:hypothetical protein
MLCWTFSPISCDVQRHQGRRRRGNTNLTVPTFGNRNKIERWFRELKNRTKRFYKEEVIPT